MTTISQAQEERTGPRFHLNIAGWLRNTVFSSMWNIVLTVILIFLNIMIIRLAYTAEPVGLSFHLLENGEPSAVGSFILTITNGPLLTISLVVLWLVGLAAVVYGAGIHRWPGPTQWLKDSLYTGPFGSLVTLALSLIAVFAIRGLLAWTVFGAAFTNNNEIVEENAEKIPGAVWGIIGSNLELFAIGRYNNAADMVYWRPWLAVFIVLVLGVLSLLAWNFGSPLQKIRKHLSWAWILSPLILFIIIRGYGESGPLQAVPTSFWGGLLVTLVLSVAGIVVSFPFGVLLALGRRSETTGVPYMWLIGIVLLLLYWIFGGFPDSATTLNIPLIFREPPIWEVTLSPINYALFQALIVIGLFWIIGYYLKGNLIKTFSIIYIEIIRGVPLITVLFMAQIMIPIFLPKGMEIDNLLRVAVGIILFSAAYLAENVRGGLQAIPNGQYEAAMAVGLSTAQSMRLIILPQALRAVIPALVGQCISLFKDTSLVAIVGIFDLLRIAQVVIAQPQWLGLQKETFAFVALVYWVFAFSMSRASQMYERKLGVGQH